ncbi:hypothetical protein [Thalassotalea castellviae]|uniref:DUF3301 domain-containing protein n=1 Tax=Thalassotalea castellviae TaxID=3075612 RepID=A0ABU3A123_9GAMM|nr:hypothetical protein [Thalassotalea sp. W431]MDT0603573.1 hypothetical protein [Thalassotalea sp. W431]
MEILVILAVGLLLWMAWQLYRAKQFTQFKQFIETELKPKIIEYLKNELIENRSELFPNSDCHIQATIDYWCRYKVRILQFALSKEIITKQWLIETGNTRNSQHLFHIEQSFIH